MTAMQKRARLADLPEDRGTLVELDGEKILLVRSGEHVQGLQATCPHAGAPLEQGAVCQGRLVCPWHKAVFRLSDGALLEPPALDALDRYLVEVTPHGDVLVSAERTGYEHPAPDSDRRQIVIIGAGAAGTAAALALRERGFGGQVVLIGEEPGAPYDRTSLSKFVLAGQMPPEEVPPIKPAEDLAGRRIHRVTGRVETLDVAGHRVVMADGSALAYDIALVATGGKPRRLDIPGADLPGVHVLRSRADAAAILAGLRPDAQVVILGASFIGLEAASALRAQNLQVRVVAPEEAPFERQFGRQIGGMFRDLHEQNGVVFHLPAQAARLEGEGRVQRVVLQDGTVLPADLVLAGVGVRPATGFLRGLKLAEGGGIRVDAGMRAAERLYAAGDVARFPLGETELRIEHWRVAQQQGRIAAHNMLGGQDRAEFVPYFWTYHYGNRFDYLGHPASWDEAVIEGDLHAQHFVALLVQRGWVVGAVGCQRERATALLAERLRQKLSRDEALRLIRAL
jgi:NADPH-dependent 2,4-dienoyl-CoA reductase/sulfur reductase-like enzyme/nitrite reductase/ring-hydroxylating ferredoxin subunit